MFLKPKWSYVIQDFKGGSFKKAPRSHQPVIFPDQKALALFYRYFGILLILNPCFMYCALYLDIDFLTPGEAAGEYGDMDEGEERWWGDGAGSGDEIFRSILGTGW